MESAIAILHFPYLTLLMSLRESRRAAAPILHRWESEFEQRAGEGRSIRVELRPRHELGAHQLGVAPGQQESKHQLIEPEPSKSAAEPEIGHRQDEARDNA